MQAYWGWCFECALPVCPGYYCVASVLNNLVTQATPCPIGTYGARPGLTAEIECSICDAGYYCETEGTVLLFQLVNPEDSFAFSFSEP